MQDLNSEFAEIANHTIRKIVYRAAQSAQDFVPQLAHKGRVPTAKSRRAARCQKKTAAVTSSTIDSGSGTVERMNADVGLAPMPSGFIPVNTTLPFIAAE